MISQPRGVGRHDPELATAIGPPERRAEDADDGFEEGAAGLGDLAAAAAGRARGGDAPRASAAFEDLRNACVQCHVTYRPDNARRGLFPARWNTVAGRVSISTVAGKERADRRTSSYLEGVRTPPDRAAAGGRLITQKGAPRAARAPDRQGRASFPERRLPSPQRLLSPSETQPFDLWASWDVVEVRVSSRAPALGGSTQHPPQMSRS
jgi:hypothetical protein